MSTLEDKEFMDKFNESTHEEIVNLADNQSEDVDVDNNIGDDSKESEDDNITDNQEGSSQEEPVEEDGTSNPVVEEEAPPTETSDDSTTEKEVKADESNNDILSRTIRANGKDIKLKSIEEAISLIQKGVDYTKKSQKLQSAKRISDSLSKHGIDEKSLSLLIDISKGDKEAIKKILLDKNIDPVDLISEDGKQSSNYTQKDNLITQVEVARNEAYAVVNESPNKDRIYEVITSKSKGWDEDSYNFLINNPRYIVELAKEVDSGMFDIIQPMLERERAIGSSRANGKTDLELYIELGAEYNSKLDTAKTNTTTDSRPIPHNQDTDKSRKSLSIAKGNSTNSNRTTMSRQQKLNAIKDDKEFLKEFHRE